MKSSMKLHLDEARSFIDSIEYDLLGGVEPTILVEEEGEGITKVTLSFYLEQDIQQDDWQLDIRPSFHGTFHWSPHLTPTEDHIIDQHAFRSPALIVCDDTKMLAVVPDLSLLSTNQPTRWYMDMDAVEHTLSIGMGLCSIADHVLFVRKPGAQYTAGTVVVAFYLFMVDDKRIAIQPWRPILQWLWEQWGKPTFLESTKISLEPFVEHTYRWAFNSWESAVWQQFELNGKVVGAPTFIVNVTQSPNYPGPYSEREFRSIWNQAWFSSLRSASGLYRYALQQGDPVLMEKALMTKELALSAPKRQGFFPAVIATEMEEVEIEGIQVKRSKGWDHHYWGNSNRNPVLPWGSVKEAPYHILDMSWTCLLMLRWYDQLQQDDRLLDYAVDYANSLVGIQDDSGFFPAWLDQASLQPLDVMRVSPETSMSVTFLLQAYQLTGKVKYKTSALRGMEAVIRDIIPYGRWEDFETYFSCSSYRSEEGLGLKVERNNMYKQCNFSMYWTAEALLMCYRLTRNHLYLDWGQRCLDEMLMTQASWQPAYMQVDVLGGFGVMNCDGEWLDARQSLFAELIVEYGLELNIEEYIERGIAALKASFVMMYCPENPRTKQQWEKKHPFFSEQDYGFMMENYGHGGTVDESGEGMGVFTIYDWGNGAAAESVMRMKEHHGALLDKYFQTTT